MALATRADTAPALQMCADIEEVVKECSLAVLESQGQFQRALTLSQGIGRLREMITDEMMESVMALQGSGLGFRTDKDISGGYPMDVVKECLIEAVLRGVYPVGNEFNIISGRTYMTKEGFARLVREFPGLTNLKLNMGVPRIKESGAIVECSAAWQQNGDRDSIEREIPIRINRGMGADAVLGKATRKLLAAIYGQLTGSEHAVPEGSIDDPLDVKAAPPVGTFKPGSGGGGAGDVPALPADRETLRQALARDGEEEAHWVKGAFEVCYNGSTNYKSLDDFDGEKVAKFCEFYAQEQR